MQTYVVYVLSRILDDDPATSKDALVTPDYPLYQKFAKLSRQEEDWGLLDFAPSPSPRLAQMLGRPLCHTQGHRVVWRKDADLPTQTAALCYKGTSSKNRNADGAKIPSRSEVELAVI